MHFVLLLLAFVLLQPTGATRMRLLLRDETGAGVAGATLTLRREDGHLLDLAMNADGVAVSDVLPGRAVWLLRGRRADGTPLVADSEPADEGFRLVLIPGQVRDALIRLDGDLLVLDPDMIFSPNDPGEVPVPTIAVLETAVPAIGAVAQPIVAAAPIAEEPRGEQTAFALLWCVGLLGLVLLVGALVVARMRVQQRDV